MKAEIIFGSLLVLALLGFFVYEFEHSNQTQTTYYASKSDSGGIFSFLPKNPLSPQSTSTKSTSNATSTAPTYFPYPRIPSAGSSASDGSSYTPYAPYPSEPSSIQNSPAFMTTLGYLPSDASPSFQKIRIGSFGQGYGGTLTFTLSGNEQGNEKINITGWQIKANHGGIFVPQAVNDYDASGNETDSDIVLGSGDQVTFYSTASPVAHNLRLNKCIGYMDTQNKFQPPLPNDCPSPNIPQVKNFSAECQDYVASLSSCTIPNLNKVQLPYYDDACRQYLQTLNYAGCQARYGSTLGFFEQNWRVYTGTNFANARHDKILLLDKQGKIVDGYTY